MINSESKENELRAYRTLRPIRYNGGVAAVGEVVDLPRWMGLNLTLSGRVEPSDPEPGDAAIRSAPFGRPVALFGVMRR